MSKRLNVCREVIRLCPDSRADELPPSIFCEENVFVLTTSRIGQEIRPLKVLILNLMPKKIETENQFLRLL